MPEDHYARSGPRWALDAELVCRPIAAELVATCPHPLTGRIVLDAGAGTGAAGAALRGAGARTLAVDLSHPMLSWQAATRPPCAVADIPALPLRSGSVDDCVAAFVLNHLTDPKSGLAELARVTRPGGPGGGLRHRQRQRGTRPDRRGGVRRRLAGAVLVPGVQGGGGPPARDLRPDGSGGHSGGPRLGARRGARCRGGDRRAGALVRYRLGHPAFAAWLDATGPRRAAGVTAAAERAVGDTMEPYRPRVVFLRARPAGAS